MALLHTPSNLVKTEGLVVYISHSIYTAVLYTIASLYCGFLFQHNYLIEWQKFACPLTDSVCLPQHLADVHLCN